MMQSPGSMQGQPGGPPQPGQSPGGPPAGYNPHAPQGMPPRMAQRPGYPYGYPGQPGYPPQGTALVYSKLKNKKSTQLKPKWKVIHLKVILAQVVIRHVQECHQVMEHHQDIPATKDTHLEAILNMDSILISTQGVWDIVS